jgi:hypothetical protein
MPNRSLPVILMAATVLALIMLVVRTREGDEVVRVASDGHAVNGQAPARGVALAATGQDAATERASGDRASPDETPLLEVPFSDADGLIEVTISADGKEPPQPASVTLYWRGNHDTTNNTFEWRVVGRAPFAQAPARFAARPGYYLVEAAANGWPRSVKVVQKPEGEVVTRVAIDLQAAGVFEGRVVEKRTKAPIPNATVSFSPLVADGRRNLPRELRWTTHADASGRFRFDDVARGEGWLTTSAQTHSTATTHVRIPDGALVVELDSASWISGFVMEPDGGAAANASVRAYSGEIEQATTTASSGSFSLEVEPGRVRVAAQRGALGAMTAVPFTVPPGATINDVRLVLSASSRLVGSVRRSTDGVPVTHALIEVSPQGQLGDVGRTESGSGGRYIVEGLAAGTYDVAVKAVGYADRNAFAVALSEGQEFTFDFNLEPLGKIAGRITDARGEGVAGAVVAVSPAPMVIEGLPTARADAEGNYELAEVPAGARFVLAGVEGSASRAYKAVQLQPGKTARVDLVVQTELSTVKGRAVMKSGGPPTQALVLYVLQVDPEREYSRFPLATDGAFEVKVAPGTYRFEVTSDQLFGTSPGIKVKAGVAPPPEVVIQVDEAEILNLTVVDGAGNPVPDAAVDLRKGKAFESWFSGCTTRSDGRCAVSTAQLPASAYFIGAFSEWRFALVEGRPDDRDVTITLREAAALEGHVVTTSYAQVGRYTASFQDPLSPMDNETSTFSGERFFLPAAPVGPNRVIIKTADGRAGSAEISLQRGERGSVTVTLDAGTVVQVRIIDAASKKPIVMPLLRVDGEWLQEIAEEGVLRLHNLAKGKHQLQVSADGYGEVHTTFFVSGGKEREQVEVQLRSVSAEGGLGFQCRRGRGSVIVWALEPKTPGAVAGLLDGDVLQEIDGHPISTIADCERWTKGRPGTSSVLSVRRGAVLLAVAVVRD